MFKFVPIATFIAPVSVVTPGGEEQTFDAEFVYLDDAANEEASQLTIGELLRKVWRGWRGIQDESGRELPYSDAQREALMRHAFVVNRVFAAYTSARAGLRAKN